MVTAAATPFFVASAACLIVGAAASRTLLAVLARGRGIG
jgi:hypothetical protein